MYPFLFYLDKFLSKQAQMPAQTESLKAAKTKTEKKNLA